MWCVFACEVSVFLRVVCVECVLGVCWLSFLFGVF